MRGPLLWVLWDVKDTLLRVRRSVGEQYCQEARRTAGFSLNPTVAEGAFRQSFDQYSKLYPNYGIDQGLGGKPWWMGVVRDTFSLCGVEDPALLDRLAHNLYHGFCSPDNWEVYPDSVRTLESISSLGLRQGVVSNFDKRLEGILQGCGLLSHFSFLLTSEEAGIAKPDPAIFQQALEKCGFPAASVAHIGDHYVNDYLTSRSLGLHGYLLDRQGRNKFPDVPPLHRLKTLDELPARLKQEMDQM
ncbi:haloacid dehalogenase-like hydrolase domain-containing protein 3 [Esox lucius]|nr:haloacid dehalogenase-like hydrolase domain-containing protein 3 [Esox lucius]XP_010879354.2 haloacid dehalogenase-like hydrolase domain-containing protein 3 [Esox lucius]XP_010879355.2 haloacid dehalogenase-like hydrolase domain-containing protein 3 [Esox lucius]